MTETKSSQGAPRSILAFLRDGRANGAGRTKAARHRGKKSSWGWRRAAAILMVLAITGGTFFGIFGGSIAQAAEDEMDLSFYDVATATTSFFSTVQSPGSTESFSKGWEKTISSPGSAGSMLGYADPDFALNSGWLTSALSASSDAIGYNTLEVRGADDKWADGGQLQGMAEYAYYGAALNGMGLDSTGTGLSLNFMSVISGGVVLGLFVIGGAVDTFFNGAISILDLLNPFKLFYAGVSAISPDFADGMVGNASPDNGPLSGLASWIGGWYQVLNGLAWGVMVPLFIGVLIFSMLLFKKIDKGGAVKKLVVRLLFIGLGLPLLGTMYTGMIGSMADATVAGNIGSSRVVLSTYVDFEKWATQSRLAVPEGARIEWDPRKAQPTGLAQANVRNTALAINNQSLGLGLAPIVTTDSEGAADASWAKQALENNGVETKSTYDSTTDVLLRHMFGAKVTAASFESVAKGELKKFYEGDDAKEELVLGWFKGLTDDTEKAEPTTNPVVAVKEGTGLTATGSGDRVRSYSSVGLGTCVWNGTQVILTNDPSPRACNLSPLAMYNYLNTDFNPTSMVMYSSAGVASEATRSIHNAVNLVGTGTMGFLYWLNAVVLLGSFVIIGLGYSLSLIFSSIKRSFQIVTAVPFATIGALAAIAKVVVYSVALVLELVVTIFIYKMVQDVLISLPQIIEMPFAQILNNSSTGDLAGFVMFLTSGWGFTLVVTLLSIIGVICFTVLALRVRKSFVKAVEEAVTKLVEKFMSTQVGMPGSGLMPALAGGVAAGAGMALTNRMTNKGGTKGAVAADAPTGDGKGGAAVTTGGGAVSTDAASAGVQGGQLELTAGVEGAAGNGDPGSPIDPRPIDGRGTEQNISQEIALGREVEANGLSKRGGDARAPQVGDDAMSSASQSLENSAAQYKAADRKQLEVGKEGTQAVGHAALAVGRGVAGDAKGAAESGGKAVQHGGEAVAAGHDAKQMKADAGRSSLDAPSSKNAQSAAKARQVASAGTAVSSVAGAAGGGTGGTKSAVNAPKIAGSTPRPTSSANSRPAPASAGSTAPAAKPASPSAAPVVKGGSQPVQAPAPKPQAPAPAPAPAQTPVSTPAPVGRPAPVQAPRAPKPAKAPSAAPVKAQRAPSPRPVARPSTQAPSKPVKPAGLPKG